MLSKCYPILRISYYICYMIKTKYLKIITAISLTSILALQLMWLCNTYIQSLYLQPIITQYFIDNKSEIWLLFLIAHSKR